MGKGKPWPVDDERRLRDWWTSGTTDVGVLVFSFEGKYSADAVRQKLLRLGLLNCVEVHAAVSPPTTTSPELELPEELPSVEEALKTLVAALRALEAPGLSRDDVLRLRGIISGIKIYKELFADYVNYRSIEADLLELKNKYEALARKSSGT